MGTSGGGRMLSFSQGRVRLLTRSHRGGLCRTGRPPLSPGGQWVSPTPREYCSSSGGNAGPGQLAQGGMEGTLRPTVHGERSEAAWYHIRWQVPPCWEPENPTLGHRQPQSPEHQQPFQITGPSCGRPGSCPRKGPQTNCFKNRPGWLRSC